MQCGLAMDRIVQHDVYGAQGFKARGPLGLELYGLGRFGFL